MTKETLRPPSLPALHRVCRSGSPFIPTTVYRWRKVLGIERPKGNTPCALREHSAPQSP